MLQFNHIILRASLITPLYALARRPYSRLACQMLCYKCYWLCCYISWASERARLLSLKRENRRIIFIPRWFVQSSAASGGGENADCNLCGPLCARNNGGFRAWWPWLVCLNGVGPPETALDFTQPPSSVLMSRRRSRKGRTRRERSFIGSQFMERSVACLAHVFEGRCESCPFTHVRWRKLTVSVF